MALRDWVRNTRGRYTELDALSATRLTAKETESRLLRFPINWWGSRLSTTKVFDEDWELLVVLDTCRADALEMLRHEFDYIPSSVPTCYSAGQTSYLWMENNFGPEYHEEMARTAHVTWNPHSENELNADDWHVLEEVWRDWPKGLRYLPASQITDRAVEVGVESDPDRMIVHYMQPHEPYPGLDVDDDYNPEDILNPDKDNLTVFGMIKEGKIDVEVVWFYYLNALRRALESIERLVDELPYEDIVLSADHGETFGKYGFYGHPGSVIHPETIRVPWLRLVRSDLQSQEIEETTSTDEQVTAEDRLRQLGYMN